MYYINICGFKLYGDVFGYKCVDKLKDYYDDSEDAYVMQKVGLMSRDIKEDISN